MRNLSLDEARRLNLSAQGFDLTPDKRGVNRRDLRKIMNTLHLLQLDSVPVITRTQYMPAFSRLGPYRADLLDEIAYRDDEWFEAWAHEASLLPVAAEPLLRWQKARSEAGQTWKGLRELADREPAYIEECYRDIVERGPLAPSELSNPRPKSGEWWGSRSVGSLALDWLFRIGRIGIRRHGNFEKAFDLIENIVPAEILSRPTPTEDEAIKELLVKSATALGVATANDLVDYFRLPPRAAKPLLPELVEDNRLAECAVENWTKPAFIIPRQRVPKSIDVRALVSPFDPVVWHRDRGERLFNFEYRIEIYVPKAKRRWGYYVLPFVLGDRIVARVDVKNDRANRKIVVPAAHIEPGCPEGVVAAELAAALWDLADFLHADSIAVGRKGDLVDSLRGAVKASARS